jgi:hypothetical protein
MEMATNYGSALEISMAMLDQHIAHALEGKFVCLFVYSHTSNFSAIWWLSPLPVTGLQI